MGPLSCRTERYGSFEEQSGDLYLPPDPKPLALCLLHGGFWRQPYGREEFAPVAEDLAGRGFPVWNLEYRRIGSVSGEWPAPISDVLDGLRHLSSLHLSIRGMIVIGHSAGGHLALLAGAAYPSGPLHAVPHLTAVVGLAALSDLGQAHRLGLGRDAVRDLLGGSPREQPRRYAEASPRHRLPFGRRQLLLHGSLDEAVPPAMSRSYAQAARAAGDAVDYGEIPSAGHMDFLDPGSVAHGTLVQWLEARMPDVAD